MKLRLAHVPLLFGICAAAAAGIGSSAGAQAHDPPDVARGRHIATALTGCAGCHGANFAGGRAFGPGPGAVRSANLTGGAGGVGTLSDADLVRAIRTGIAPDGSHLRVMPSEEYAVMTDADVADVVAFLRTVPPVDNVIARASAPGAPPAASSAADAPAAGVPAVALTGGAYLARIGGCTGCHGAALTGGVSPSKVATPNISRTGIGTWTLADFTTAMRTGKTPQGRTLSPAMPWETFGNMTDDELRDVYTFLQSQPGRAN